jgi:hypothetical protein
MCVCVRMSSGAGGLLYGGGEGGEHASVYIVWYDSHAHFIQFEPMLLVWNRAALYFVLAGGCPECLEDGVGDDAKNDPTLKRMRALVLALSTYAGSPDDESANTDENRTR